MGTKTRPVIETYTVDDLTGREAKRGRLIKRRFRIGQVEGDLEATQATRDAFVDLLRGNDKAWRKLFEAKPAATPKADQTTTTATATNPAANEASANALTPAANGETKAARQWAKETPEGQALCAEHNYPVGDRARLPNWLTDAYREAAHQAAEAERQDLIEQAAA